MPRSPSRDLADRYLGNRTYFRRWNRLEKWKWGLSFLALLGAGLYVAAGYASRKVGDYRLTHGPLTNVHATWDNDCAVCHVPAGEVKDAGLLRADKRWAALTCDKCHVGPKHWPGQSEEPGNNENDCASCHHDHQGRDNSLVRIADSHCTRCHADPAVVQKHNLKAIPDFAAHPQPKLFQPGKADEYVAKNRGLRFSHALHLTPGMTYPWDGANPGAQRRPGDYAAAPGGGRYSEYANKDGLLELRCDACHQTDSGLMGKDINRPALTGDPKKGDALEQLLGTLPRYAVRPPKGSGDIFLPVSYDLHCKTCHPNGGKDKSIAETTLDDFPNFHRLQPPELLQMLERQYIGNVYAVTLDRTGKPDPAKAAAQAKALEAEQEKIKKELAKRPKTLDDLLPMPGTRNRPPANNPDPPAKKADANARPDLDLARQARRVAEQWVDLALDPRPADTGPLAASYCAKCHVVTGRDGASASAAGRVADLRIAPTNSPSVWYANAKFNHAAHRGTACLSCHPGVQPDPVKYKAIDKGVGKGDPAADKASYAAFFATEKPKPTDHLPGFDECRKCHAPAAVTNGVPTGGVRYGCTECHRYHLGDHPLQGRGATGRNPAADKQYKTFEEFLGGKPAGKTP